MSEFTIRAKNFRVLEHLEWSPSGVCLLAGANGAGKTTVLDVLTFVRVLFDRGHEAAFIAIDGDNFRRTGTSPDELVTFEVEVEEIRWKLRFSMTDTGMKGTYGEELYRGDELVLRMGLFADRWHLGKDEIPLNPNEARSCAKLHYDSGKAPWMEPLAIALSRIRIYKEFWMNQVRRPDASDAHAAVLKGNGTNLWSVLANWKSAPLRYGGQFDWVFLTARQAFPDLLGAIEFDRGQAFLFRPGSTDPAEGLPPRRQADGLLTGLLQLAAVAGARRGAIVAIDELENQLHPHAIRVILEAMRQQAEERDLTIVLTTHSPVVMNEFKGFEESFYVLTRGTSGPQPRPLLAVRDEAWLSHFALGDLYEREAIAPQHTPHPPQS